MNLETAYQQIIVLLNKYHFDYLVIGGIAVGILGEPRMTGDIDVCIFIKKNQIDNFLNKVEKGGFQFSRQEVKERIKETGTFKIMFGDFHIDFIIASSAFEKDALKRRQKIKFEDVTAFFPSVEDLIIYKLVAGRLQDIVDIEKIMIRHRNILDIQYLEKWVQRLSDETENLRMWNGLRRLLKKTS